MKKYFTDSSIRVELCLEWSGLDIQFIEKAQVDTDLSKILVPA